MFPPSEAIPCQSAGPTPPAMATRETLSDQGLGPARSWRASQLPTAVTARTTSQNWCPRSESQARAGEDGLPPEVTEGEAPEAPEGRVARLRETTAVREATVDTRRG